MANRERERKNCTILLSSFWWFRAVLPDTREIDSVSQKKSLWNSLGGANEPNLRVCAARRERIIEYNASLWLGVFTRTTFIHPISVSQHSGWTSSHVTANLSSRCWRFRSDSVEPNDATTTFRTGTFLVRCRHSRQYTRSIRVLGETATDCVRSNVDKPATSFQRERRHCGEEDGGRLACQGSYAHVVWRACA